jgi:hypothetical protein
MYRLPSTQSLLGPRPIFRFGEVAPFRPQVLEVEHGLGHLRRAPLELPAVSVPGLDDLGVCLAQRGCQGRHRQSIKDHGQGVGRPGLGSLV